MLRATRSWPQVARSVLERRWLPPLEARVFAALGRDSEVRSSFDRAETAVGILDTDPLLPSAFGYNEAQLRQVLDLLDDRQRALPAARDLQEFLLADAEPEGSRPPC